MKNIITLPSTEKQTNHSVEIELPASKSISNRLLILSALADSPYPIQNIALCDDTNALLNALESNNNRFDIGAAGTAMRFLTAYLAKIGGSWEITGSKRMKERPIKILVDALNQLGGNISYIEKEGYPPLSIKGRALIGGEINLDASVSSQYISALMMIAPTMRDGLTIHFSTEPISLPYIRMTSLLMSEMGVTATIHGNTLRIPQGQEYIPRPMRVEADWSAASYGYEIAALSKVPITLTMNGLKKESAQGDAKIAKIYEALGIKTQYTKEGVIISKQGEVTKKMIYNFTNEPDLAQTVICTCCALQIPFYFSGLQSLKIKETNRVEALICELRKLGYHIEESKPNTLTYDGNFQQPEVAMSISTYEDHRMAMAFAPMALRIGKVIIDNPKVVSKSFPHYWSELKKFVDIENNEK